MSTTARSHAEPTLFLTDSEEFQVRAHTTKNGDLFFSTVDFIRNVLEEDVSKDEAIMLWMIITQIHRDREYHICNNRMVLFAGPYGLATPCLKAEGLLFMYHYMGQTLKMKLKEAIRPEVQSVLLEVARGNNIEKHVRMHDDGEISEIITEMVENPPLYPRPESSYTFARLVMDVDGKRIQVQEFMKIKEEMEKMLRESNAALEQKNSELIAMLQKQSQQLTELEMLKTLEDRKRKRKEGFCVGDLIAEEKLAVEEDDVANLCKSVIAAFKKNFPEREVYTKHSKTFFAREDMEIVKALLYQEYRNILIIAVDKEPVERGVGTVFSDTARV